MFYGAIVFNREYKRKANVFWKAWDLIKIHARKVHIQQFTAKLKIKFGKHKSTLCSVAMH